MEVSFQIKKYKKCIHGPAVSRQAVEGINVDFTTL